MKLGALACLGLDGENKSKAVLYAFRFYSCYKKKKIILADEKSKEGISQRLVLRLVEHTLYRISRKPQGRDIIKIVDIVYFFDADTALRKGDISMRVIKASMQLHYSERQIYYYLKQLRQVFFEVLFEFEKFNAI